MAFALAEEKSLRIDSQLVVSLESPERETTVNPIINPTNSLAA